MYTKFVLRAPDGTQLEVGTIALKDVNVPPPVVITLDALEALAKLAHENGGVIPVSQEDAEALMSGEEERIAEVSKSPSSALRHFFDGADRMSPGNRPARKADPPSSN